MPDARRRSPFHRTIPARSCARWSRTAMSAAISCRLSKLCRNHRAWQPAANRGWRKNGGLETYVVAAGRQRPQPTSACCKAPWSGAVLDELRNGPLDKHGAGSAHPLASTHAGASGRDRPPRHLRQSRCNDSAGGIDRTLTARRRSRPSCRKSASAPGMRHRWYYPMLMKGEWPVLLEHPGRGRERALSSARRGQTLFVAPIDSPSIAARLPKP